MTQSVFPQAGELLDRLTAQVRSTLKSPSAVQIHDLRVDIRRYSQALVVLKEMTESRNVEKILQKLNQTMHLAGAVRDCDIAMELLKKMDPPKLLQARLERQHASAKGKLVKALHAWVDRRSAAKWRVCMTQGPIRKHAGDVLSRAVKRATKRLVARGKAAEKSRKNLHPLRIAAKKLRYTLDLLTPAPVEWIERIKQLQSHLGDINDYETVRRTVRALGAGKRIADHLEKKRDEEIHEFRKFWDAEFAKEGLAGHAGSNK
jgi:CHAD domain-containing protein